MQNENGNGNGETIPARVTGADLRDRGLDALDVTHYEKMPVDSMTKQGEISEIDWMKIMELGKALAAMQDGMPVHVRGKWGIGCRIAANAYQWKFDPFAVADQTFLVGNRLGYMSQLIHARINKAAPLRQRVECEYIGEGEERICIVRGTFVTGETREYTSPKFKDIHPKNSPSWKNDPDQQLFYFSVRAWARKWVPEVLLGIYTKEELQADPSLGYEETAPGLHARLRGSPRSDEGHKAGHAVAQLAELDNGGTTTEKPAEIDREERPRRDAAAPMDDRPAKPAKRTVGRPRGKQAKKHADTADAKPATKPAKTAKETASDPNTATAVAYPSTVAEYVAYARRWIKTETDRVVIGQRWQQERAMRNRIGMTKEDRQPLEELMQRRLNE